MIVMHENVFMKGQNYDKVIMQNAAVFIAASFPIFSVWLCHEFLGHQFTVEIFCYRWEEWIYKQYCMYSNNILLP